MQQTRDTLSCSCPLTCTNRAGNAALTLTFVPYFRVSTDPEGRSLGLEAQRRTVADYVRNAPMSRED